MDNLNKKRTEACRGSFNIHGWIPFHRSKSRLRLLLLQVLIRNTTQKELQTIATYYFDGKGKALRPMVAILMARAINYHKERKWVVRGTPLCGFLQVRRRWSCEFSRSTKLRLNELYSNESVLFNSSHREDLPSGV